MCMNNAKTFFTEYQRLTSPGMGDIRDAYIIKMRIYFLLCFFVMLYYTGLILQHSYLFVADATDLTEYTLEGVRELVCCFVNAAIATLFHPHMFTLSFRLAQISFNEVRWKIKL